MTPEKEVDAARPDASRFFCSELSRRSGESGVGTASTGAVWLLLEYPHGWSRRAFEESALPPEVKRFFKDATARIRHSRVLFVKTDRGRTDPRMNLFVVRCRERAPSVVRLRVERYYDLLAYDLSAVASGRDTQGGETLDEPLFLVCTHGRRDKCCAKFGVPVYNALRESVGDAVWQSSHVGGDRFAGNLVCFPHGLFYAHTTPESGVAIAEGYRAGRVAPGEFRGRACYSHFIQAAEAFVRGETGLLGVEDLHFLAAEPAHADAWRVRFAERGTRRLHEATVARRMSDFSNPITCHAAEPTPVPQFALEDYRASTEPLNE
ncbi:MAG TPA: sucrase ferredoxin [Pyrinomonadaceae bacterium]